MASIHFSYNRTYAWVLHLFGDLSLAQKTWATSMLTSQGQLLEFSCHYAIIASIIFLALGVPQTLNGYTTIKTIEGATQTILVGPVASLDSIMQIGTNGGGYYGANAAYPFMNPSPITNILMISLMLLLPTALIFVFGEMIGKKRRVKTAFMGCLYPLWT